MSSRFREGAPQRVLEWEATEISEESQAMSTPDASSGSSSTDGRARTAIAGLLTLAIGVAVTLGPPSAAPAQAQAGAQPTAGRGERLYLRDCGWCHGPQAEGTSRGPSLERAGAAGTDFMLRTGRMPIADPAESLERRSPAYGEEEIAAIVAYVSRIAGGPAVPRVRPSDDLTLGGEQYRVECAACHGATGGGGALLDQSIPGILDASPVEVAEAVITGPGAMPAFGETALSVRERDAVVAYVAFLQQPPRHGGLALKGGDRVAEGAIALMVFLGAIVPFLVWLGRRG